jgi:hypothetical protein
MTHKIKNYLKKYHEANLWLELSYVREEKKQALQSTTEAQTGFEPVSETILHQPQVVFTHYDVGHNQEETNRIQELYNELDRLPLLPRLAVV